MTKGDAPRRIGVLGGMGPEATILFMSRVLSLTPARDDADHIPLIVDNNTQVPSRLSAIIGHGPDDPAPVLAGMARKLEAYGAEALAMPCNTAHAYAPAVREAVSIPLLDMVALACEVSVKISKSARVGILGSPALRLAHVYDAPMSVAGLVAIWPREEAAVVDAIRALKRSSSDQAAIDTAQSTVQALTAAGCGAILVACTEFSLITEKLSADIPLIDTLDVLAAATVAFSGAQ